MEYQERLAKEMAKGHQDIDWLLEAVGKDLKALEKEFIEYMDTYEKLEDPDVKAFVKLYNMFSY